MASHMDRVVREGLSEEVTFELIPKEQEGTRLARKGVLNRGNIKGEGSKAIHFLKSRIVTW